MTEFNKWYELVMSVIEDKPHMKILFKGALDQMLLHYESEKIEELQNALQTLYNMYSETWGTVDREFYKSLL